MKRFCAYTRVSTAKQGEKGVSLQEQKDAITRFANRGNLDITAWFEERETAAKQGRPVFNKMLALLKQGRADGVIIHKIDRSARNLKDWANLGELIDSGIEVHFANESLDLNTRGGRLSADIQAVVASDYIRNLREETRKGFYGRLKQGLYPRPAPLGYLDAGPGRPKEPDPQMAPLIKRAFELYSTGAYNLTTLVSAMARLGLRNRNGRQVSRTRLWEILRDPFYIGLIRVKKTNETFEGAHRPLLSKYLFEWVQDVFDGKNRTHIQKHDFQFRRMLNCATCGHSLNGEKQKGHTYYRCHYQSCGTVCLREERVEESLLNVLEPLEFSADERVYVRAKIEELREDLPKQKESQINAVKLRLSRIGERLARLIDAYVDGVLDKQIFEERKSTLITERLDLKRNLEEAVNETRLLPDELGKFLELAGSAYQTYKIALPEEKRELLEIVTSNRLAEGKKLKVKLSLPFERVARRFENVDGGPRQDVPRTWDSLLLELVQLVPSFPEHSRFRWQSSLGQADPPGPTGTTA